MEGSLKRDFVTTRRNYIIAKKILDIANAKADQVYLSADPSDSEINEWADKVTAITFEAENAKFKGEKLFLDATKKIVAIKGLSLIELFDVKHILHREKIINILLRWDVEND